MIRRQDGHDLLLITQHDHAQIAGQLAESFGNNTFPPPIPRDPALLGIALHDSGWPLHDDEATLNGNHLPLDVFETPRAIAFAVWTASVETATKADPYAGLLVSLHVLSLSVMATDRANPDSHFDLEDPQDRFAIVKFQQRELERQENLRAQLGLRSEKSAHHTVAKTPRQESEDQLQYNFALLQIMDQLSLAACCTTSPLETTRDLPLPDSSKQKFTVTRQANDLAINPWPFAVPELELLIPASRIPSRPYKTDAEFRSVLKQAPSEIITCRVRGG
jgi:hypothetical protein